MLKDTGDESLLFTRIKSRTTVSSQFSPLVWPSSNAQDSNGNELFARDIRDPNLSPLKKMLGNI